MRCRDWLLGCSDLLYVRDCTVYKLYLITTRITLIQAVFMKEKERKKSLARGHVKDIGSAEGIHSFRGQGYEGAIAGKCLCDFPVPSSLRDSCALRAACRARPMSV